MEEKNVVKINLSTLLLLLVVIVLGIFMYKLYNDQKEESKKFTELQTQVNSLTGSVTELQGTIDNISNVINKINENISQINNNIVDEDSSSKKNSNSSSSTSVSDSDKNSVSSKILGKWMVDKAVDANGNSVEITTIFGTGIHSFNNIIFKENGVIIYNIGILAASNEGEYTVNGNTINYGLPTETKGEWSWKTLTYIPEEDVLKGEEYEGSIVTYIRAD